MHDGVYREAMVNVSWSSLQPSCFLLLTNPTKSPPLMLSPYSSFTCLSSFLFLSPSSTCKFQDHPFASIDVLILSFLASSQQLKSFRNKSNNVEGYNRESRVFLPYLLLFRTTDCVMVIKHGHGNKGTGDTERGRSGNYMGKYVRGCTVDNWSGWFLTPFCKLLSLSKPLT